MIIDSLPHTIWIILSVVLQFVGFLKTASEFTNVEYTDGNGSTRYAYLKLPENFNASETYPAAIVFHAWNGMGEEPVYFADKLADEGYIAIAPDMFRNVAAGNLQIPWNIFTVVTYPQSQIDEDVDSAIQYLEETYGDSLSHIVSGPGFCFGGSQALELSRRFEINATISLYGSSISGFGESTSSDDDVWGLIGANGSPLLGIYGALDQGPSPEQVASFEIALQQREIDNNITIYPDVGHAFVNPDAYEDGNEQAVEAWKQVLTFFADVVSVSPENESNKSMRNRRERRNSNIGNTKYSQRENKYEALYDWSMIQDHLTDKMLHKGHGKKNHRFV